MKYYICLLLLCTSISIHAQSVSLFNKANTLYNNGKFTEAINLYNEILDTGQHSAELYYNLGNAHYKLNNIAPSIYFFEKAKLLNPKDKEINNNLAFANNMTIDAIDTIPEVGFSKFVKRITHIFHFDIWASITVMLAFLCVFMVLLYYFSYSSTKKRLSFVASIICLLFLGCTLGLTYNKFALDKKDNPAIVFAQESQIKTEPNLRSEEAFRLHEGTKVQVTDTVKNWKKIKLSDGKIGWVSSEDIKILKDF